MGEIRLGGKVKYSSICVRIAIANKSKCGKGNRSRDELGWNRAVAYYIRVFQSLHSMKYELRAFFGEE